VDDHHFDYNKKLTPPKKKKKKLLTSRLTWENKKYLKKKNISLEYAFISSTHHSQCACALSSLANLWQNDTFFIYNLLFVWCIMIFYLKNVWDQSWLLCFFHENVFSFVTSQFVTTDNTFFSLQFSICF
jgi:hypothetical protein